MPKLHAEALLFAIAWAGLAIYGGLEGGWWVGALLSAGLLLIIMPASSLMLAKAGDFAAERRLRWGILALATAGLFVWLNL